jgi:hypothetical protein
LDYLNSNSSGRYVSDNSKGNNGEPLIGAGGNYFFDFYSKNIGEISLEFEYKRNWEKQAIETYNINIKVVKDKKYTFTTNSFVTEEVSNTKFTIISSLSGILLFLLG